MRPAGTVDEEQLRPPVSGIGEYLRAPTSVLGESLSDPFLRMHPPLIGCSALTVQGVAGIGVAGCAVAGLDLGYRR